MPVITFYQNAIIALAFETVWPFYAPSPAYYGRKGYDFVIEPSELAVPPLQHNHIVWALQSVAETIFANRRYYDFIGVIKVSTPRGTTAIGTISLRPPSGDNALPDTALALTQSNSTAAPQGGISAVQNLGHLITRSSDTLDADNGMYFEPYYGLNAKKFQSTSVFLTIIRALARIAEYETSAKVSKFTYDDHALEISILFTASQDQPLTTTYADLASSLPQIVAAMIRDKTWKECGAIYYRKGPPRIIYGRISMVKI